MGIVPPKRDKGAILDIDSCRNSEWPELAASRFPSPFPSRKGRPRRSGIRKARAEVLLPDLAPAATIRGAVSSDGGVKGCPERRSKNGWRRWRDR
jgi:hypothetical protein